MDIDGSSIQNPQNTEDIDQNLLLQFSCMNTTDRDELVRQMQKVLGPSLCPNAAAFFLDMNNWNLQAAVCFYMDCIQPENLFRMTLRSSKGQESAVEPGARFDQSWNIVNSGSEQWNGSWKIVQTGGESFSSIPIYVPPLPPGQSTTVVMRLVAPSYPGTYKGHFRLINEKNEQIGETLCAEVTVDSEVTMALANQFASLPVPSGRPDDSGPSVSQMSSPPDDQMC